MVKKVVTVVLSLNTSFWQGKTIQFLVWNWIASLNWSNQSLIVISQNRPKLVLTNDIKPEYLAKTLKTLDITLRVNKHFTLDKHLFAYHSLHTITHNKLLFVTLNILLFTLSQLSWFVYLDFSLSTCHSWLFSLNMSILICHCLYVTLVDFLFLTSYSWFVPFNVTFDTSLLIRHFWYVTLDSWYIPLNTSLISSLFCWS